MASPDLGAMSRREATVLSIPHGRSCRTLMRIFHCDHCDQLVFFENTHCVHCGHALAFLPDINEVGSLEPAPAADQDGGDEIGAEPAIWISPAAGAEEHRYRLCQNYREAQVCNWAVLASDPQPLCPSCRLTRVIPDLSVPGHREAWYRLEVAKRRVVYSLLNLGLPVVNRLDDPEHGLAFEFLADPAPGEAPVLTGHGNGVITINVAEADDAERERRRTALHEPYRTLVGHVRHEIGHYYWDRLIAGSDSLDTFRTLFGDEREDYGKALERHYAEGPPADWRDRFVTAYASAHAWEDWAETWAHYLHMTDALETAAACGLSIRPRRQGEPALTKAPATAGTASGSFDRLIASWFPLTYVLNNLNRGLGLPDGYPFVLSSPAIAKLRFVHDTIAAAASTSLPEDGLKAS
jgi:hypothetical protein